MNDDIRSQFCDFGALGYDDDRIMSVLGCNKKTLDEYYENGAREEYDTGENRFLFAVERKLMQLAVTGDLKAIQKLEVNKRLRGLSR